MDEEAHAAFCEHIGLSEAQQKFADHLFGVYTEQIDAVATRAEASLAESMQQLMKLPREAFAVGATNSPEVQQVLIDASRTVEQVFRSARSGQVDALEQYQASLGETLTEQQLERVPAALRHWRRGIMLNPNDRPGARGRDLNRHADLVEDIEALAEDDESFRSWKDTSAEFGELVDVYEIELDDLLTRSFWSAWSDALSARTKAMRGRVDAMDKPAARAIERWMRVYRLNVRTVESLSAIADAQQQTTLGERLLSKLRDSYFPWLYSDKSADIAHQWLMASSEIGEQEKQTVALIYAELVRQRTPLRIQMERAMIAHASDDDVMPAVVGMHRLMGQGSQRMQDLTQRRRELNQSFLDRMMREIPAELREVLMTEIRQAGTGVGEGMEFEQ